MRMIPIEEALTHFGELYEYRQDLTDESIQSKFLMTAIMFAQQTSLIKREFEIPLQDCVTDYLLENCDDVEILYFDRIESEDENGKVSCDKFFMTDQPCNGSRIESPCATGCNGGRGNGAVSCLFVPSTNTVSLSASAGLSTRILRLTASVAPTYNSCEIDEEFISKHKLPLLYGTLALIAETGFESKYSPFASKYRQMFQDEMTRHTIRASLNGFRHPVKIKSPRLV